MALPPSQHFNIRIHKWFPEIFFLTFKTQCRSSEECLFSMPVYKTEVFCELTKYGCHVKLRLFKFIFILVFYKQSSTPSRKHLRSTCAVCPVSTSGPFTGTAWSYRNTLTLIDKGWPAIRGGCYQGSSNSVISLTVPSRIVSFNKNIRKEKPKDKGPDSRARFKSYHS